MCDDSSGQIYSDLNRIGLMDKRLSFNMPGAASLKHESITHSLGQGDCLAKGFRDIEISRNLWVKFLFCQTDLWLLVYGDASI